jgi:hypothetical protein
MAMLESERLRLLQEAATKVVSRFKCNDSSLQTLIVQAQACSRSAPATVAGVVDRGNGCATNVVATGKGTNGEYLGILQVAQGCAICPDTAPAGPEVPAIVLPTVCPDYTRQPFAQQGISAVDPAPYIAPCTDPGNRVYFPAKQNKGSACNYKHLPYDS